MSETIYIQEKYIKKFISKIFQVLKVPIIERNNLSKSLIGSSLRGVDSHGIRLLPHYIKCLEKGRIKVNPKMKYKKLMNSVGLVNADNGFGHSAAFIAAFNAIKLAKENGIGLVGVINSSHYGAAGAYSLEIAEKNFIGFCFTHSDAFAIPFNGIKKFHGTNPYSFSSPIKNKKPLLVDFSSTSIPWNTVLRAKSNNKKLIKDVAFDIFGNPTTNPNITKSLSPLGGNSFGHKGFGLSSSIEVLCGPLLGLMHGFRILSMDGPNFKNHRNLGHLIIAININAITSRKIYFNNMSQYISDLKSQKSKKNKKILYPGEKEWIEEKKRKKIGIPFDYELINNFQQLDKKFNLNYFKSLI